jgi:hypothetical protein
MTYSTMVHMSMAHFPKFERLIVYVVFLFLSLFVKLDPNSADVYWSISLDPKCALEIPDGLSRVFIFLCKVSYIKDMRQMRR